MHIVRLAIAILVTATPLCAQQRQYSRADTLRGSNGPAREWWDAEFHDLNVTVNPADSTIRGWNGITYRVLQPRTEMQIDLQHPLVIDSIVQGRQKLRFRRDSNAFFVTVPSSPAGTRATVTIYYHGKPRAARRAPSGSFSSWPPSTSTGPATSRHLAP